jgi:hypothetical protein
MHLLLHFRVWRFYQFFLKEGFHLSLFVILFITPSWVYGLHWIDIFLSFFKKPKFAKIGVPM